MRNRMTAAIALVVCACAAFAGADVPSEPSAFIAPSARFILQLGVLVFAAKSGGALFERWRMPVVLGELMAGVLVGPHLLGGLSLPFFPKGLMSDVSVLLAPNAPVYSVVTVTLVVLFFLIGLDTDVRQVRRYSVGGVAAGLSGFALSFAAALSVLVCAAGPLTGCRLGWTSPSALLFSTVISVTSVGVLARMLAARQRLESPAGVVALTAAMTDNMAGLLFFTVFSGVAQAVSQGAESSVALIVSITVRTLVGLGLVALVGFPIARHMNALALREKRFAGAFVVSAACLLMAGGMMGVSGLSVMAGAYMMGIAFSSTDLRHEIRERLDFVNMVLVPACFAALGMQVNPNLLADGGVVAAGLLFAVAVALSKLAGCAGPSALAGLNVVGCLRVGVVSLPRGELSLAMLAAMMGVAALSEGLFFDLILIVTVSCLCSSVLTDRVFARGGGGVRGGFVMPDPVRIVFQFPSHQAALLMVNRAVEIFEDEGFYAHLLNRHQTIYRISRESQVITLRRTESEVVFECSERERSLVNTVMLELSSGVEQSLRELRKPLDDVALRRNMQRPNVLTSVPSGVLRNRFLPETLRPRLLATTKQGVIAELVGLLYENGLVNDRERAVRAVFEREQSLSTGLEFGVAMPHARTDAVSQLVCAVGLKKEGLDFDALDGRPVRIVVLVLAPESAPSPQLQFIAQMCRLLNERGRAALLACETCEDMYGVMTGGVSGGAAREKGSPLSACLEWQSIALDMATCNRDQMVALLLALCVRSGAVGAIEEIHHDIQACSELTPETLAPGVALLAVQTQNVYRMVAAIGVRAQAAEEADGCGRVWVMVLYPASAAAELIRVKTALARTLEGAGLKALLSAKTSKEALDVLLRAGC